MDTSVGALCGGVEGDAATPGWPGHLQVIAHLSLAPERRPRSSALETQAPGLHQVCRGWLMASWKGRGRRSLVHPPGPGPLRRKQHESHHLPAPGVLMEGCEPGPSVGTSRVTLLFCFLRKKVLCYSSGL